MVDLEPILVPDGELGCGCRGTASRAGILQFWVIRRTVLPPADRITGAFTQEIDRVIDSGLGGVGGDVAPRVMPV